MDKLFDEVTIDEEEREAKRAREEARGEGGVGGTWGVGRAGEGGGGLMFDSTRFVSYVSETLGRGLSPVGRRGREHDETRVDRVVVPGS